MQRLVGFLLGACAVASMVATAGARPVPFCAQGGLIFVEASIPGAARPLQLIVDSGAEESVLSLRTAEEIGLELVSRETILGVGGHELAHRSAPTPLYLDGRRLFTKHLLVMDLGEESRQLGTRVDGLLGMDFFERRVVRFDFARSQLELASQARHRPGAVVLPASRSNGVLCVAADVGGVSLPRLRVDTGCTRALCWSVPEGAGIRRPWRDGARREVSVSLGSRRLPELASHLYRDPIFPGENGLLGLRTLDRFDTVWIDSVRSRLVLEGG